MGLHIALGVGGGKAGAVCILSVSATTLLKQYAAADIGVSLHMVTLCCVNGCGHSVYGLVYMRRDVKPDVLYVVRRSSHSYNEHMRRWKNSTCGKRHLSAGQVRPQVFVMLYVCVTSDMWQAAFVGWSGAYRYALCVCVGVGGLVDGHSYRSDGHGAHLCWWSHAPCSIRLCLCMFMTCTACH
jgi:hypothetical protein